MVAGYPIGWALPTGSKLQSHPLYIKYSNILLGSIDPTEVQVDLAGVQPIPVNAEICAYLSWLIRTAFLLQ